MHLIATLTVWDFLVVGGQVRSMPLVELRPLPIR